MSEYSYQPWPCWCIGPNGENEIFQREEDVPAGWEHHGVIVDTNGSCAGAADDIKVLRSQYETMFGKRAFRGWSADELKRRMA